MNNCKCFIVDVCETLFPGVVHLEALDLLSKECESKVNLKAGSGGHGVDKINNLATITL